MVCFEIDQQYQNGSHHYIRGCWEEGSPDSLKQTGCSNNQVKVKCKMLTSEPVVGDRNLVDHLKVLELLFQNSDQPSGQVINEWSVNGLKWSRLLFRIADILIDYTPDSLSNRKFRKFQAWKITKQCAYKPVEQVIAMITLNSQAFLVQRYFKLLSYCSPYYTYKLSELTF